jgi:hypothetical protein
VLDENSRLGELGTDSTNRRFALFAQLNGTLVVDLPSVEHGPTSENRLIMEEAAGPPCRNVISGSSVGLLRL